jgi:HK97 family phage portal protein
MLHDQPNPLQPAHRFWSTACAHYLLWGNVFVEKLRGQMGLVEELWLLDPAATSVEWDKNVRVKRFVQHTTEGKKTWSGEQVLHIVGFSTDGLIGRSPIATARESVGTALAREQFEGGFYQRGGSIQGVLTHPQTLSEEAKQRLKLSFDQERRTGHFPVIEEGIEITPISMPLEDMQFVENQQMSLRSIANIFNLPVSYLNGSSGDSLTYATVESNQIQFAQVTLTPIINMFAKALARDPSIFPQNAWFPEFLVDAIHRGDMKSRVEYFKTMVDIGAMTINEVRAIENMPPLPHGDSQPEPPSPPPDQEMQSSNGAPPGAFSLPASQEG